VDDHHGVLLPGLASLLVSNTASQIDNLLTADKGTASSTQLVPPDKVLGERLVNGFKTAADGALNSEAVWGCRGRNVDAFHGCLRDVSGRLALGDAASLGGNCSWGRQFILAQDYAVSVMLVTCSRERLLNSQISHQNAPGRARLHNCQVPHIQNPPIAAEVLAAREESSLAREEIRGVDW